MAGSIATRSPLRGPSAITPAPSCPSTSGCVSLASPIAPSSHQCRSEPQMPTAVTRTRLIPGPASGTGSSPTRKSPTACSLAARTRSPPVGVSVLIFIQNGPWFPLRARASLGLPGVKVPLDTFLRSDGQTLMLLNTACQDLRLGRGAAGGGAMGQRIRSSSVRCLAVLAAPLLVLGVMAGTAPASAASPLQPLPHQSGGRTPADAAAPAA